MRSGFGGTAGADDEGLLFFVAVRFLFFVADTGGRSRFDKHGRNERDFDGNERND